MLGQTDRPGRRADAPGLERGDEARLRQQLVRETSIGWSPAVSLDEGLQRTIEFVRQSTLTLSDRPIRQVNWPGEVAQDSKDCAQMMQDFKRRLPN